VVVAQLRLLRAGTSAASAVMAAVTMMTGNPSADLLRSPSAVPRGATADLFRTRRGAADTARQASPIAVAHGGG
jgi:hypothetical protein